MVDIFKDSEDNGDIKAFVTARVQSDLISKLSVMTFLYRQGIYHNSLKQRETNKERVCQSSSELALVIFYLVSRAL